MSQENAMNYCCSCKWAIKKGLFFKRWYCTCPEIMEKTRKTSINPVTGESKTTVCETVECVELRALRFGHLEVLPDRNIPCRHFKEKAYALPRTNPLPPPLLPDRRIWNNFVPPKTTPTHEPPPIPEVVSGDGMVHILKKTHDSMLMDIKLFVGLLKATCNMHEEGAHCTGYDLGCHRKCNVYNTIKKYDEKDGVE